MSSSGSVPLSPHLSPLAGRGRREAAGEGESLLGAIEGPPHPDRLASLANPTSPRRRGEVNPAATPAPGEDGILVAGVALVADCAGALWWPEERLLVVADLHLEKGSSFAARGVLLPPYDTAATLAALARLIVRYAPRLVVSLGDSFHDRKGPARIAVADRASLSALQRGRDWMWIAGNHDPEPADGIGGTFAEMRSVGALAFRHEPSGQTPDGEIAGHLHPVARISQRGRAVSRRCFATDGRRLVMPAFGAYTGGLNVRHRAFADVFDTLEFTAHMLGRTRLYALAAARCLPD